MAEYHVSTVRKLLDKELLEVKPQDRKPHSLSVYVLPRSAKKCENTRVQEYPAAIVTGNHKRGDLYRFQLLPSYEVISVRMVALVSIDDVPVYI